VAGYKPQSCDVALQYLRKNAAMVATRLLV